MEKILFVLIIAIVVFEFLLERVLDYLNATCWSEKLPEELQGIYEQEKYSRSQQYLKANHWFSQLTESFNFILVMLMLLLGGFAFLDNQVRAITDNPVLMALLFFGAIGVVADFLGTPFSIYSTFVIEQRFGFNKTT
ncbi:MAG TPA: M48 family peptidase, partial [Bacteroidales bacterium]|nr:M48 family peptidase [Bacteroidales bacterium]